MTKAANGTDPGMLFPSGDFYSIPGSVAVSAVVYFIQRSSQS